MYHDGAEGRLRSPAQTDKGEEVNRACLCGCRSAVSTAGLKRKRAGNEKQNGVQKNGTKHKTVDPSQIE